MQDDEIHLGLLLIPAGGDLQTRDDHKLIGQLGLQTVEKDPFRVTLILVFNKVRYASCHRSAMSGMTA